MEDMANAKVEIAGQHHSITELTADMASQSYEFKADEERTKKIIADTRKFMDTVNAQLQRSHGDERAGAQTDAWASSGRDPWNTDGNDRSGGGHGSSGAPGSGGGGAPGAPHGTHGSGAHGPSTGARADPVTWRTKLFDAKIATTAKYQYNGSDHGDAWKRNMFGFLVGQCPLVSKMLTWAEKRVMEPISMADYREQEISGTFGNMRGESPEVLGGHIWSFLQMCVSGSAATTFESCPGQNGLEAWRALTWEINAGRGSRLGSLQEFVAKPPAVRRYQDVSSALATFDGKLQDLLDAGGERPKDLTLKRALLQSFPSDLREALVMRASDLDEDFATFKRVVRTKIAFILECNGTRSSPAHSLEDQVQPANVIDDVEAFIAGRNDLSDEAKEELLAVYRGGRPGAQRPGGQRFGQRPGGPGGARAPPPRPGAGSRPGAAARTPSRCTMCGSTAHSRSECTKGFVPMADRPCFNCGKKGHQKSRCPELQNGKAVNAFEPEEESIFTCFPCELEPLTDSDGFTVVGKHRSKPMPTKATLGDFIVNDNRLKALMDEDDVQDHVSLVQSTRAPLSDCTGSKHVYNSRNFKSALRVLHDGDMDAAAVGPQMPGMYHCHACGTWWDASLGAPCLRCQSTARVSFDLVDVRDTMTINLEDDELFPALNDGTEKHASRDKPCANGQAAGEPAGGVQGPAWAACIASPSGVCSSTRAHGQAPQSHNNEPTAITNQPTDHNSTHPPSSQQQPTAIIAPSTRTATVTSPPSPPPSSSHSRPTRGGRGSGGSLPLTKAATPKPPTCACNATECGKAVGGVEQARSLKDILGRFETSDIDKQRSDLWFSAYLQGATGTAPVSSSECCGNDTADDAKQSSHVTEEHPGRGATTDRRADLTLNHEEYGRLDAKCLEVEMTSTELLATPNASVRKRTIRVAMDSGAGDHVASPEDVEGFAIEESANSRAGRNFIAANGGKIKNHGQSTVRMKTKAGKRVASTFQVADVTRPLYSVSKLCDAGYDVAFSKTEALVTKGGEVVHRFHREGGLYVAEMSIGDDEPDPSFGGQGAKR